MRLALLLLILTIVIGPASAGGTVTLAYCDGYSIENLPVKVKVIEFDANGDPLPPYYVTDSEVVYIIIYSLYYDGASPNPATMDRLMRWVLYDASDVELGRWRIWRYLSIAWPYPSYQYILEPLTGGNCYGLGDDYLGGFYE